MHSISSAWYYSKAKQLLRCAKRQQRTKFQALSVAPIQYIHTNELSANQTLRQHARYILG